MLAVGSKDTSVRVYCLDRVANFRTVTLGSQSDAIVGVFFEKDSLDVTTVARYKIINSKFLVQPVYLYGLCFLPL